MDSSPAARVGCLVLAAGGGSRFGGRKQLACLGGRPLLEHAIVAATRSPAGRVVVVLGSHAKDIRGAVALGRAEAVVCEGWRKGMSAPLRRGVEALAEMDAVLVVLGDQPLVGVAAIERVLAAWRPGCRAVRATYRGRPGHPVLLERPLFGAIGELRGDIGARGVLEAAEVVEVACEDIADPLDVDRPEDLALAELRLND